MKLTNIYGLPDPIVRAVSNDTYRKVGDISVTGLIKSPRKVLLEARHDAEISEDVSERIWILLGQSVHAVLERATSEHHLSEEKLKAEVLGWTVSGQVDLLEGDMTLSDYKVTSVFSYLLGDKPEWGVQLNCYAWLYRKQGFKPKKLQIVAILRDWISSRAGQGDYPEAPIVVIPIKEWTDEGCQKYVEERVALHKSCLEIGDNDLPECTPQEMWERETTYAVKKCRAKRAVSGGAGFKSMAEAKVFINNNGAGLEIEERPGSRPKCERFCNAAPWCNQFKSFLEG